MLVYLRNSTIMQSVNVHRFGSSDYRYCGLSVIAPIQGTAVTLPRTRGQSRASVDFRILDLTGDISLECRKAGYTKSLYLAG